MTINQFTFFAMVAKHRNLTKASYELRVSQPSVSQQLRLLERNYGAKLYRRIGRGIELTEEGDLFLKNVMPILDQFSKLKTMFKGSVQPSEREVLRVGGTFSPSAILLPALLARFRQKRPGVELEFRTTTSDRLERLLLTGVIEIGVSSNVPRSGALCSEPLRREKLVMFVLPGHRLAKKSKLTLSEVLAEPLIIRGGRGSYGTTEKLVKQLRDEGCQLTVGMRCDGPSAVKAAVRRKMGVGVVFEDAVKTEVINREFKILNVRGLTLQGSNYIIYSKDKPLSPMAQEFLELLRRARPNNQNRVDYGPKVVVSQ